MIFKNIINTLSSYFVRLFGTSAKFGQPELFNVRNSLIDLVSKLLLLIFNDMVCVDKFHKLCWLERKQLNETINQ